MERKASKRDTQKRSQDLSRAGAVVVREYEPADNAQVLAIFHEGLMEMVPDTAFRALRHHPESVLLYAAVTVAVFLVTMCWWVIVLLPAIVLCGRYFYSSRVIQGYLQKALSRDMGNIEEFYTKSSGSRLWVAVLEGKVVGVVAAVSHQKSGGAVELQRMAVDRNWRQRGIGVALGQKVVEYAVAHKHSSVVLGTTAYTPAAHRLYQKLGFRCVGVTNDYVTPGSRSSFLERIFYRVCHHHYSLNLQNGEITNGNSDLSGPARGSSDNVSIKKQQTYSSGK